MNFIIDIGNTVAKLAVFQDGELLDKIVVEREKLPEKIKDYTRKFSQPEFVVVSNVTASTLDYKDYFENSTQILEINDQTSLPFINKYASPASLGNDRKALVAAAVKHYPKKNVLIIDAGTCITFDFKNDKEEYFGGGISPGLKMRFLALHTFTANLPLIEGNDHFSLIGDSTVNSIKSGVINGILCEIDGVVNQYSNKFENLVTIITGGDASFLSINLKNGIFANSNFLLEGLNYILEFNNNQ